LAGFAAVLIALTTGVAACFNLLLMPVRPVALIAFFVAAEELLKPFTILFLRVSPEEGANISAAATPMALPMRAPIMNSSDDFEIMGLSPILQRIIYAKA
jgi:hypothetical protein